MSCSLNPHRHPLKSDVADSLPHAVKVGAGALSTNVDVPDGFRSIVQNTQQMHEGIA